MRCERRWCVSCCRSGARLQMQKLIDGPVYLELFVKVVPHWRQKPGRLAELGYRGE